MPWNIKNDLSGKTFGHWLVIRRCELKRRPVYWICRCKCGIEKSVPDCNLKRGLSTQCLKCGSQKAGKDRRLNIGEVHGQYKILSHKVRGYLCICANGHESVRSVDRLSIQCSKCHKTKRMKKAYAIGQTFGPLTVIKHSLEGYGCRCVCGKEMTIPGTRLMFMKRREKTLGDNSCLCEAANRWIKKSQALVGTKYGYFKIIKFLGYGEDKRARYLLKCKCGTKMEKGCKHLYNSLSCGCLQKERVPKGSQQTQSKLNEEEVKSARALFESGLYTQREIAKMLGISPSALGKAIHGSSWKHV